jgi:DNA-binding MarR family transcriptional regulator
MVVKQDQIFHLEKLLRTVFRKMRQEVNSILGSEVSSNEFSVLKILWLSGSQKASDISKELNVSASHITTVTDSLAKKEYITRTRSDRDRRVVELVLTDTGRNLVQTLEEKKSVYLQSKFDKFSEDELRLFITLFQKFQE